MFKSDDQDSKTTLRTFKYMSCTMIKNILKTPNCGCLNQLHIRVLLSVMKVDSFGCLSAIQNNILLLQQCRDACPSPYTMIRLTSAHNVHLESILQTSFNISNNIVIICANYSRCSRLNAFGTLCMIP